MSVQSKIKAVLVHADRIDFTNINFVFAAFDVASNKMHSGDTFGMSQKAVNEVIAISDVLSLSQCCESDRVVFFKLQKRKEHVALC